jgi:hypothetical protein
MPVSNAAMPHAQERGCAPRHLPSRPAGVKVRTQLRLVRSSKRCNSASRSLLEGPGSTSQKDGDGPPFSWAGLKWTAPDLSFSLPQYLHCSCVFSANAGARSIECL